MRVEAAVSTLGLEKLLAGVGGMRLSGPAEPRDLPSSSLVPQVSPFTCHQFVDAGQGHLVLGVEEATGAGSLRESGEGWELPQSVPPAPGRAVGMDLHPCALSPAMSRSEELPGRARRFRRARTGWEGRRGCGGMGSGCAGMGSRRGRGPVRGAAPAIPGVPVAPGRPGRRGGGWCRAASPGRSRRRSRSAAGRPPPPRAPALLRGPTLGAGLREPRASPKPPAPALPGSPGKVGRRPPGAPLMAQDFGRAGPERRGPERPGKEPRAPGTAPASRPPLRHPALPWHPCPGIPPLGTRDSAHPDPSEPAIPPPAAPLSGTGGGKEAGGRDGSSAGGRRRGGGPRHPRNSALGRGYRPGGSGVPQALPRAGEPPNPAAAVRTAGEAAR